jgi:hypothetical protein
MLFTFQRPHFVPSKRHFHSGPPLLAGFPRFSIVICLKDSLPLLQKPASNDAFSTILRRAVNPMEEANGLRFILHLVIGWLYKLVCGFSSAVFAVLAA